MKALLALMDASFAKLSPRTINPTLKRRTSFFEVSSDFAASMYPYLEANEGLVPLPHWHAKGILNLELGCCVPCSAKHSRLAVLVERTLAVGTLILGDYFIA